MSRVLADIEELTGQPGGAPAPTPATPIMPSAPSASRVLREIDELTAQPPAAPVAPAAPAAPQAAPKKPLTQRLPGTPEYEEFVQGELEKAKRGEVPPALLRDSASVLDELAIRKREKQIITAPGAGYPLHVEDERAILSSGEDVRKWSVEQLQKRQEVLQGQVEGLQRQGAADLPEPEAAQPHGVIMSDLQAMIETAEANPRIPEAVKEQVRDLLSPAVAPEAWERAGEIGVGEELARKDWAAWLPVVGIAFDVAHMRRTKEAAERLQEEDREPGFYKELEDREMTGTLRAAFGGPLRTADARQAADEAIVTRFLLDVAETDARGVTWPAVVAEGVVNLLPYMIEFALTAGAATIAKGAVQTGGKMALRKLGVHLAGRFAKRIAASKGVAAAARLTNMAARAAIGGAVRAPMWGVAEIEERQIPVMELGRRGKIIFQREGETPAQAVLHGLLSGWIEAATEEMGQEIFGPLGRAAADKLAAKVPLVGKLLSHLDDLRGKVPRLAALSKSAGYSDLISEMGEEQAGRTIRAVIGLGPPGSMDEARGILERLAASVPSVGELLTEGAILAAPALLRLGAGVAARPAPPAAPVPAVPAPPEAVPAAPAPPVAPPAAEAAPVQPIPPAAVAPETLIPAGEPRFAAPALPPAERVAPVVGAEPEVAPEAEYEIINSRGNRTWKRTFASRAEAQKFLEKKITSAPGRIQFMVRPVEKVGPPVGPTPEIAPEAPRMPQVERGGPGVQEEGEGVEDGGIEGPELPPVEPGDRGEQGAIPIEQVVSAAGRAVHWVKGALRRFGTTPGDLPLAVFNKKLRAEGRIARTSFDMLNRVADFEAAAKRTYGKALWRLDEETILALDAALKGEATLDTIPEGVRGQIMQMRLDVDAMSDALVASGAAQGPVVATIIANKGTYLRRSYQVHEDPKWAKKVPQDVRNQAIAFVRSEFSESLSSDYLDTVDVAYRPDLWNAEQTESGERPWTVRRQSPLDVLVTKRGTLRQWGSEEAANKAARKENVEIVAGQARLPGTTENVFVEARVEGYIAHLLEEGTAAENPIRFLSQGKLGTKDLGVLMRRKDIPEPIRKLFGEYKHPVVNYVKSMTAMTGLMEWHKMLVGVRAAGLNRWFYEQPTTGLSPYGGEGQENFSVRIAADQSPTMRPLDGLYTTPEIKRAFEEAYDHTAHSALFRVYMTANGLVKYSKTVLSWQTHVRNFASNALFAIAQGHFRVGKFKEGFRATFARLVGTKDVALRAYIGELIELRVVDESARGGELADVMRDASKYELDEFVGGAMRRMWTRVKKAPMKLYQVEDNVWKVYGFENELAAYRKAFPEAEESWLKEKAAAIVRDTYPTYAMIPKGIRLLRRFPVVGPFVSFPAEVMRLSGKTVALAAREMQDPRTRAIGARRIAGMLVASTIITAICAVSRRLLGISDEDDEAIREFLPPWSENSSLLYVGRDDDGNPRIVDLSYTDPFAYIRKPIIGFLRTGTAGDRLERFLGEAVDPYFSEEILFAALADIARNKQTPSGRMIYNPEASPEQQLREQAEYLWKAFEPGTVTSARRIVKGATGTRSEAGRLYDWKTESAAMFLGARIQSVDVPQSLGFRVYEYTESRVRANRIFWGTATNRGVVSQKELEESYVETERSRRSLYAEMRKRVLAARRLGIAGEAVHAILREKGLSRNDSDDLMQGVYRYYVPSKESLGNLRKILLAAGGRAREAEAEARIAGVKAVANELGPSPISGLPTDVMVESPRPKSSTIVSGG